MGGGNLGSERRAAQMSMRGASPLVATGKLRKRPPMAMISRVERFDDAISQGECEREAKGCEREAHTGVLDGRSTEHQHVHGPAGHR